MFEVAFERVGDLVALVLERLRICKLSRCAPQPHQQLSDNFDSQQRAQASFAAEFADMCLHGCYSSATRQISMCL